MQTRKRTIVIMLLTGLLLIGLAALQGCKKKSAPATLPKTGTVAAAVEQTICPVLASPIDKNIFTEYKGKKVYFCCTECKQAFEMDPEKYIAKLPQFAK